MGAPIPAVRVTDLNPAPVRGDRDFVLYWMTAQRRTVWNHALQHAAWHAREIGKPLLIFEALRADYQWASARFHAFVVEGMAANAARCEAVGVRYHPYVEPVAGGGRGLLEALAARACLVVADEFPCFFLPRMLRAAAARLDVALQQVDANGLLPLRAADRAWPTAYAFRRFLQRTLPDHLDDMPMADPLRGLKRLGRATIPRPVLDRWPAVPKAALSGDTAWLRAQPVDQAVGQTALRGGSAAAEQQLLRFLKRALPIYAEQRNQPEVEASSGLSPYLHFGHLSPHQAFAKLATREDWSPERLSKDRRGHRAGWWGMSTEAEAFLDELVTWREVGYGFAFHRADDYHRFDSLPDWAQATLQKHADDPREHLYALDEFEQAQTHDPLWNAAQRQLVREGRMHNYLRMLWGKKILEWCPAPTAALDVMIELNNKYALDGRNPNSYSGIFWVLGRFDRPWGPERPVFGTVRFMSSQNTARKVRVKGYIEQYAGGGLFG
ncbi:MAG: deoxyribodipyrimidine photolyase [Planctomycetota bacterium]